MALKMICFDLDGVFFEDINFWMRLHEEFGTLEEGKILTQRYLRTDYPRLVQEVVGRLWKGKDAGPYHTLVKSLRYLPGVPELMSHVKKLDPITAIISASSIDCARRVQQDYGFDHIFANELVIRDGKVSGDFVWPIGPGNEKKADIIKHLAKDLNIPLKDIVYIGDSDTDSEAFKIVGTSIAFNSASEALKKLATHIVEGNDLSRVIPYLK